MSSYTLIFDDTISTINRRAGNHRNLVVVTCFVLVLAIVVSIVGSSLRHLCLVALLVPISGVFFYRDSFLNQLWRTNILNSWVSGDIELGILQSSVRELPHLPEGTRDAMLSILPDMGSAEAEMGLDKPSREAVSLIVLSVNQVRGKLAIARTAMMTMVVACVVIFIYSQSLWLAVPAIAILLMYAVLKKRWISRQAKRLETQLHTTTNESSLNSSTIQACVAQYNIAPFEHIKLSPVAID